MANSSDLRRLVTVVELIVKSKEGLKQLKNEERALVKRADKLEQIEAVLKESLETIDKEYRRYIKQAVKETAKVVEGRQKDSNRKQEAELRDHFRQMARIQNISEKKTEAELDMHFNELRRIENERIAKLRAKRKKVIDERHRQEKQAQRRRRNQVHKETLDEIAEIRARRLAADRIGKKATRDFDRALLARRRLLARNMKAMERRMRNHGRRMRALRRNIGFAFLPTVAGTALAGHFIYDRMIKKTADAADEAKVLSEQLGMNAQAFQEVHIASDLAGVKFGQVRTAIRRMVDNAGDFVRGKGQAVDAFTEMGISADMINGPLADTDKLLLEVSKRLTKFSEFKRGNLAAQIFGRAGAKSLPLFGDIERFQLFRRIAKQTGAVIGVDLTEAAQKFNDEMIKVKLAIAGIRNDMSARLLPVLSDVAAGMFRWWLGNRKIILQRMDWWVDRLVEGVDTLVYLFDRVDRGVNQFSDWGRVFQLAGWGLAAFSTGLIAMGAYMVTGRLAEGFATVMKFIADKKGLIPTLKFLGGKAGPIAAVMAMIAAFTVRIEDWITFMRGGESALGDWLDMFLRSADAGQLVQDIVVGLADKFGDFGAVLGKHLPTIWEMVDAMRSAVAFTSMLFSPREFASRMGSGRYLGLVLEPIYRANAREKNEQRYAEAAAAHAASMGGSPSSSTSNSTINATFINDQAPVPMLQSLKSAFQGLTGGREG